MKRLAVSLCVGFTLLVSGALLSDAQTTTVVPSASFSAPPMETRPNSLIEAQDGNFYGTTALVGAGSCTSTTGTRWAVELFFSMTADSERCGVVDYDSVRASAAGTDGGKPDRDDSGADGSLYGTTASAAYLIQDHGNANCGSVDTGCGMIFEIAPSSPPALGQLIPI